MTEKGRHYNLHTPDISRITPKEIRLEQLDGLLRAGELEIEEKLE